MILKERLTKNMSNDFLIYIGSKVFSISSDFNDENLIYKEISNNIKMDFAEYQMIAVKIFAEKIDNFLSPSEMYRIQKKLADNIDMEVKIVDGRWAIAYKPTSGSIPINNLTVFMNVPDSKTSRETNQIDLCFDILTFTGAFCIGTLNSKFFRMQFDWNGDLIAIKHQKLKYNINYVKQGSPLSYKEESFKFQYSHIKDIEYVKQLLPEMFTIGVYDYTSDNFAERFDYYNLLNY